MRKVLLKFFADMNLGDDLMIRELLGRFPDCAFYVCTRKEREMLPFSGDANFIRTPGGYVRRILGRPKMDAYIFVGGSILNYNGAVGLYYQFKEILLCGLCRMRGIRTLVLGANLSGPPSGRSRRLFKAVLGVRIRLLDLITLRDAYSYEQIRPYAPEKAYVFPDIVFSCFEARTREPRPGTLGISVFGNRYAAGDPEKILEQLARVADRYLEQPENRVILFAMDTGRTSDADSMDRIHRMIRHPERVQRVAYEGDSEAFLDKIGQCGCFLPIRFHALVLCLACGIPFVPVVYANKTENLLNDIGYDGFRCRLDELPHISAGELADRLRDCSAHGFVWNREQLEDSIRRARGHYDKMASLGADGRSD